MTDIYAHITVIDTNTGKIIPRNRFGWEFMAAAFMIGYNWQADRFNEQIDSWNSEFDKTHPNHGDLMNNDEYHQFILDRWQPIIDQYNNELAKHTDSVKFIIENFTVCMVAYDGYKVGMQLITE